MAVPSSTLKDLDLRALEENQENQVHNFLHEIYGFQAASSSDNLLSLKGKSFNESAYAHIVKTFNSAIMCSPEGEACSELLKILDRLEEQIFGEIEATGQGDGSVKSGVLRHPYKYDSDVSQSTPRDDAFSLYPSWSKRSSDSCCRMFPTCGNCRGIGRSEESLQRSISATSASAVFDQQHPTSPVSGQHRSRSSQGSLSSTSLDFSSALQDSLQSPEASVTECVENCYSDPPKKSGFSSVTPVLRAQDDLGSRSICFKGTVRKLENAFVECSSKSDGSNVFRKLEFFSNQKTLLGSAGKKKSSRKEFSQSFFSSWGSKSSEPVKVQPSNAGKSGIPKEKHLRSSFAKEASLVPEIACKPLMLVSKTSRHRIPGRSVTSDTELAAPSLKRRSPSLTSSFAAKCSSELVKGSLQCAANKDGDISYNLWLDETEELLVAKAVTQDISEDQELCDKVFVFFSYKCKGKGKSGWRQWGKKEKPVVVEVLGKMKVLSTVIPVMDRGGKHKHFIDSDFVLLEARLKEVINSPVTSSSTRLSFSSWDTTPCESPRCLSSSSESPGFTSYMKPLRSPASPQNSHPFKSSSEKHSTPGKWSSANFLRPRKEVAQSAYNSHAWPKESDAESRSYVEVASMVTRVPIQLKKKTTTIEQRAKGSWESRLKRNNPVVGPNASTLGNQRKQLEDPYEKMNVNVVLPAGEHGCPAYGLPGPQPLLERWRSGGKCDCGSWDMGCGLIVLGNQQNTRCSAKAVQEQAGSVSVVVQGKNHKVALKLAPLYDEDTFSVTFQQPLSTLQAFGTAVAILHSRAKPSKLLKEEKLPEMKKKLPKIPLRALVGSSGMLHEALTGFPKIRRVYSLGCHPEPLSLVERV